MAPKAPLAASGKATLMWGAREFRPTRSSGALGLAIGSPKATLSGTGTALSTALSTSQAQSDIAAQQQKINDDASKLIGLPVIKIGVGYVF
jgi:hypothetical protein